jgi:hypothetical protein
VVVADPHMPVHVRADQPEDDGLVAHQGLVVGLGIADGPFIVAAVGQLVPEMPMGQCSSGISDELDPVVRDSHGEAVVKAEAPVLLRCGRLGMPLTSSATVTASGRRPWTRRLARARCR